MSSCYPSVSLLVGGDVPEHDLSLYSFQYLYGELQRLSESTEFALSCVYYITRDNKAVITPVDLARPASSYLVPGEVALSVGTAFRAMESAGDFVFSLVDSQARFPGIASTFGIPGNFGSGLGSTLALSKFHLGELVRGRYQGVGVPRTAALRSVDQLERVLAQFPGEELVAKPNALGSSVLVERFDGSTQDRVRLSAHVSRILNYDDLALVQQYVRGREFTCYCLEAEAGTEVLALKEIITPGQFYGLREKYASDGRVQYRFVSDDERARPQMLRIKDFCAELADDIGLQNASRFDFIVDESDASVYFLEVNANPTLKAYVEALSSYRGGATVLDLISAVMENSRRRPVKEGAFPMDVAPGNLVVTEQS